MAGKTTFTAKEDRFIKESYLKIPIKTITKMLNRSGCGVRCRMKAMNLVVPKYLGMQI